jgi:hypothetical protein
MLDIVIYRRYKLWIHVFLTRKKKGIQGGTILGAVTHSLILPWLYDLL